MKTQFRTAYILSIIILILAIAAAAGGLFFPGIYRDNEMIRSAWFGNDIVTLFVVIPCFSVSLYRSVKGSERAMLVWIGLLGFMLYNFAFYLFGTAFNKLFLVYVCLFTLSGYALIIAISKLDVNSLCRQFAAKTPVKSLAVFLLFLAVPLGVVEISQVLNFVLNDVYPQAPTLVFALDLSFVIPNLILTAILLWRRAGWGYLLGVIMLLKGFTYGAVLIASTAAVAGFSLEGKWDPLIFFYVFISFGSFVGGAVLLKNFRQSVQEP